MKNIPLVSIIIANWNGGHTFEDCLRALSKIFYKNFEIILVDNNSTDASENLIKNFFPPSKFKIVKNKENLGFATANNQALKYVKGKYVLLLNNDTKVHPDFLKLLITKAESDPLIGVIQPKIYMMDKENYLDNAGSLITSIGFFEHVGFGEKDGKKFDSEREILSAKGACMLIRTKVINEIGLFDKDFFSYFEETDFCWRVWLIGYKVIFYPKAHIYHKVGFTIKRLDVLNINFHYYKNRISSLIKNLEFKNLIFILPAHLFVSFGIAFVFLIRRQPKNTLMILKAIWWNIKNISKTIKKRQQIQKTRKIGDQILLEKFKTPTNWKKFYNDFKRVEKDIKPK